MTIDLNTSEKGGKTTLVNDLNFAQARYESKHTVTFKNPSQHLVALLRETGPVPGDENGGAGAGGAGGAGSKKKDEKKRKRPAVDMEKLADGLVKLDEEDLLQVVQMIHDNKAPDTYTKNDVERKSFFPTSGLTIFLPFVPAFEAGSGVPWFEGGRWPPGWLYGGELKANSGERLQKANFTWIYTHFQKHYKRTSGDSFRTRECTRKTKPSIKEHQSHLHVVDRCHHRLPRLPSGINPHLLCRV